ncbi:flagellar export protein FliJ [Desulfofalx alkaliphila]|uniref:flagellar export protein FliJ n=1 Tax=Desulfofalx alkaliphila TaxID=105483 RepID=UPI0004E27228|nr:flagellar export protein FliJ [Desulfofalx alkaliphila]
MKKFQFRLEPVLQLRCQKEKEALLQQSRADTLYRERLKALKETENTLNNSLKPLPNNPVGELHRILYQDHLRMKMVQQTHQVHLAQQKVEEARQVSRVARQERMVLEKLKEKQLQEHLDYTRMLETKIIDELGTGMYYRKHHTNR